MVTFQHSLPCESVEFLSSVVYIQNDQGAVSMKNAKCIATEVCYAVGFWRRILMFQSWKQFYSFSTAVAAAICVVALTARFLIPDFSSPSAVFTVPAGAIFAALFLVVGALPATFHITVDTVQSMALLINDIEGKICRMGYKKNVAAGFSYIPKTPKWLSWNENRISVTCKDNVVTLCGPKLTLNALRKRLETSS